MSKTLVAAMLSTSIVFFWNTPAAKASELYLCESQASYELTSDGWLKPGDFKNHRIYPQISFDTDSGLLRMSASTTTQMQVLNEGGKSSSVVAVSTNGRTHEWLRIISYKPGMPFIFVDYLSAVMTGSCKIGP